MASSDLSPDLVRQALTDLRNGLLRLHKALLYSERAVYEREIQRIRSSGQFLNLVMHDPWFAWLHELSELIVLIDETWDSDRAPTQRDADRLVSAARLLLSPREDGAGFRRRYFEAMQRDPDVVLCHAATVKLLKRLR
jgi:hypothetical protein